MSVRQKVSCPRCKGHGSIHPADKGDDCSLCGGHGELWKILPFVGSYRRKWSKTDQLYWW